MSRFSLFVYTIVAVALGIVIAACAPAQSALSPTLAPAGAQTAPTAQSATTSPVSATVAPAPTTASTSSAAATDTIKLTAVPGKSEARYRVREQLAQVPLPSDAIGKTAQISGTIVGKADGSIVSSDSKFSVDLNSLTSDRSQRDSFIKRSVLQTTQYPNAVFVPTQVQGLPLQIPPTGPVTFKLVGDLTVRNVTKPVTWDVKCDPQGDQGTCTATTSFTFGYFGLQQPQVPVVLSVQDNITLEVDIALQRAS